MEDSTTELGRLADIAETFSSYEGFNNVVVELGARSVRARARGKTCLELGSADGAMTHLIADRFEEFVAVDGSSAFVERVQRELGPHHPQLTAVHALFEEYDPGRTFDTIVAAHVLEHVDDPVDVCRRALPWLSDGGALIVVVPNAHSFNRLLGVAMGMIQTPDELVAGDHAIGHRRVYTPERLEADLADAGWRIVERSGVLFKPLANSQMGEHFTPEMVEGCYRLGEDFPDNAGDILVVCEPA